MVIEQLIVKSGYEQSEVGIIPEDWHLIKLDKICSKIGDGIHATPKYVNYSNIFFINGNNLVNDSIKISEDTKCIDESELKKHKKDLEENTILMSINGTIGNLAMYKNEKVVLGKSIAYIQLKKNVETKFIFYLLQTSTVQNFYENELTGTTIRNLSLKSIRNTQITLPKDPKEQYIISKILSDIDELIKQLDYLIEKKKNIKQGAMQELLTGKRRLEGFSGEWITKPLSECGTITMGQSPESKFYNKKDIGLPLIQGNADIYDRKTIVRTFTSVYPKCGHRGDTIMSVRAPVGEIAKATFDCCLGRGVCAISYVNDYIYHYMIFIEDRWTTLSTGSTFDSINSKEISNLELFLPKSYEEQIAIAKILSDMDVEIKELETKKDKYVMIKNGMMQKLLTGEIRVK